VVILGPFYDEQAKVFMLSMTPFERRSGIDVVFLSGARPYETDLTTRLETEDPPDIVIFPQPSWLARLAEQGEAIDLRTFIDDEYLRQQYPEAFLSLATVDGKLMGIWHTVGLKSLVWYPKQAFEAKGYEVPETWDELIALSDLIVADGGTPWCIGINELEFAGWVGTDWVEDILLRTASPETYDTWVKHELPFNSPEIRRVFEIMGQIWLNDDYVYGGTSAIFTESFIESPSHLFEDPPGCYLHKQGTFARFFFPQGASYGQDYDFFYLPPIDPEFGNPVLGSGHVFVMFKDRPEVREVMRYLTTAESTEALIKNGGFLSPHRDTPIEWFPSTADLRFAQIVLSADTYRFDGSDLMPAEVGLGSFYRGIVSWVQGADLETVLQEIDDSWPE
jgi:alpha-glucoside transport system substrate-binding protein